MNYLIVDDHPMTGQGVIESLRESGDAFAEAGTGEEAIDYCAHHHPDWVIMDVKMPGRGGLFASREISANRPGMRILVISQYADRFMADEARAAGVVDFISKQGPHRGSARDPQRARQELGGAKRDHLNFSSGREAPNASIESHETTKFQHGPTPIRV